MRCRAILSEAGLLERLYMDFCDSKGWPMLLDLIPQAVRPMPLQRMLGRAAQGIPSQKITAFNLLGLRYAQRD